jgi:outer membrane immunogenic protein
MHKEEATMTRKFVSLLGIVAAGTLAAQAAVAADLPARPVYKAAEPVQVANWTGFYVGVGGGYGMFDADHNATLGGLAVTEGTVGGKGWFGTAQVGGDYQFANRFVAGVFGDFDFSSIKGTTSELALGNFSLKQRNAYAAGGRIGYLITPQILSYFDGGYTHANFSGGAITLPVAPFTATGFTFPNQNYSGFFLGGGTEIMLAPGWSVKSEYRFARYGAETTSLVPATTPPLAETLKPSVQTIRTTLIYKFNWGR